MSRKDDATGKLWNLLRRLAPAQGLDRTDVKEVVGAILEAAREQPDKEPGPDIEERIMKAALKVKERTGLCPTHIFLGAEAWKVMVTQLDEERWPALRRRGMLEPMPYYDMNLTGLDVAVVVTEAPGLPLPDAIVLGVEP